MSDVKRDGGRQYWQSLHALPETSEYRQLNGNQPDPDSLKDNNAFSRRNFLTLMGASMALAGLTSCRRPVNKIVPYVMQPEEVIPGVPQYYATSFPFENDAFGLIVECHEGRPTKIEGNPTHPSSKGAASFLTQATILGLYDPDRSKRVLHEGREVEHDDFVSFWRTQLDRYRQSNGEGLAILSEPFSSPSLARLKHDLLSALPKAKWFCYEPLSDENALKGAENIAGKPVRPLYRYEKAKVILSIDADFLQNESGSVTAMRGFAEGRRMKETTDEMNRLYVVESAFTITGGMADHRLRMTSERAGHFALALAYELKNQGLKIGDLPQRELPSFDRKWLGAVAKDLLGAKGKSIVVAGRRQPAWVHELVLALNDALGNLGSMVEMYPLRDACTADSSGPISLISLVQEIAAAKVSTLVMLGGNPVYDVPRHLHFGEQLKKVEASVHFATHVDETSLGSTWQLPRAHYLESWGDVRSADGTLGVVQPMIEPLFGGKSDCEMYSLLASGQVGRGYDIVRATWKKIIKGSDFEAGWRKVLHDGLLTDSALKTEKVKLRKSMKDIVEAAPGPVKAATAENLEIGFYLSNVWDGRYANNGWLQELPDAVTKLAWDNAAVISPLTAEELGLVNGDMVKIWFMKKSLEMPVWVTPGFSDYSVSLPLGYGRTAAGKVGDGVGFNSYPMHGESRMHFVEGATIEKTGATHRMANTQDHSRMEGRPIIREAALKEYRANPEFAKKMVEHPPLRSIYPDHDYSKGYQWAMVIDLNVCTGCNACTIACQSENNVPIVGKDQVWRGREMHWIRLDRYFEGEVDDPRMVHQPVACQQCENAPCEQVCPVAATVHDKEGINTMNYNRCIGTRYCSNNCPYKVRRFNFFNYTKDMPETIQMAQNPDVTVRSRGVMEKCTFCLQRINRAKIKAKAEDRTVTDGEVTTACQQTCPAKAISFGNRNDMSSEVAALKKRERNYELLGEFNVRPRNSYLAKLRNPNPELKTGDDA